MTFKEREKAFIQEAEQELEYIADPSQCGNIVRGHFDGIVIGVYVFMALFLLGAIAAIYLYSHHG